MKKIKLLLSRILPCLLVIVTVITFVGCKKDPEEETNYPSVSPTVSDPNGTFMTIGNYKVTRKAVYDRLVQNYGLDILEDMINKNIVNISYDSNYSDKDFLINYYVIKYGTDVDEDTKADLLNKDEAQIEAAIKEAAGDTADEAVKLFEENMRASGYFSEAEYKENYYRLSYQTMNYVVVKFKEYVDEYNNDEDNEEDYFTEETMKEYYEANNHSKVEAILIVFDSEYQALQEMENCNIDINKLHGTWEINGAPATPATLQEVFKAMYKNVYGTDYQKTVYEYKDLSTISSVIAEKAYVLTDLNTDEDKMNSSYTHGPLVAGSRYYLMLKLEESDVPTKFDKLEQAKLDEITHKLVENTISEYYITKILCEAHIAHNLKIYDQGLETKYVIDYDAAFAGLEITDYDAYPTTDEESETVVASYELNGTKVEITADELYAELIKRYGSAISLSLLQQYVLLTNSDYNSVINFETNEILDQDKYDEYYKDDVQQFKTSFEEGNYATSGYPASYGWSNFIHDYLGVNSEMDIIKSMDGSLISDAKDILAKTLWTTKNEVKDDETGETTTVTDDTLVQEEMENIFNEFFSVAMIGVYVYYDKDQDGIADHYANEADSDALSNELLEKIYADAKALYVAEQYLDTTFESALSETVTAYKLASTTHSTWGKYKKAGLKAVAIASTNYTNSSSINETLKESLKALWKEALDIDSQKLAGKSLDPGYRYTTSLETIASSKIVSFENNVLVISNSGIDEGDYVSFTYEDKDYVRKVLSSKTSEDEEDNYILTLAEEDAPLVNYYTPLHFTSNTLFINNTDEETNPNVAYKVSLVKVTDHTYISGTTYKPTLEDYEEYLEDSSSVSSSMKTAITTYYVPAIENILSIDGVSEAKVINAILALCEEEINNISWSANGETIKAQVEQLIQDSK